MPSRAIFIGGPQLLDNALVLAQIMLGNDAMSVLLGSIALLITLDTASEL